MSSFINWMDSRSRVVKILFCLPIVDILWGLYRLFAAIIKKDWLELVLAILWIIIAAEIGWIFDIICILVTGHIFWFKD